MTRKLTIILSAALCTGLLSGSALAFQDLPEDQRVPIMALKEKGIVSGLENDKFVPQASASYAQSIHLLVSGLKLNIDNMKFVKQPQASDYFTGVPNDAWYAEDFIIAHLNGLPIPRDVDPNAPISREVFANLLIHAIESKGTFPMVKMMVVFEDEPEIQPELSGAAQRMVLYQIIKLPEDRKFNPKRELTRGEAAVWVHSAMSFLEAHQAEQQPQAPQEDVKLTVEKVNDEVNRVVLSRGSKPTAGYGIEITAIRFEKDRAILSYSLTDPLPDSMNATVITEPKAETFIASGYTPVLEGDSGQ